MTGTSGASHTIEGTTYIGYDDFSAVSLTGQPDIRQELPLRKACSGDIARCITSKPVRQRRLPAGVSTPQVLL
jgi:hypothetical protein